MFELIVMRHAKSDWDNQLTDIERPLNNRGTRDATLMGAFLKKQHLTPDTIIVSAAERTQQTLQALLKNFDVDKNNLCITDSLYLASISTLLATAQHYAEDGKRLMILAHNPGVDELVNYLADSPAKPTASGKIMVTCAAAVFRFEALDNLKRPGAAELTDLYRPKEISL